MSFRKSTAVMAIGVAISTAAAADITTYSFAGTASGTINGKSFTGATLEISLWKYWGWSFIDAGDDNPYTGYHVINPSVPFYTQNSYFQIKGPFEYSARGTEATYLKFESGSDRVALGTVSNGVEHTKITMADFGLAHFGALDSTPWRNYHYSNVGATSPASSSAAFMTNEGLLQITSFTGVAFSGLVPEPGSFALAGLGLVGLAATSRRRKKLGHA